MIRARAHRPLGSLAAALFAFIAFPASGEGDLKPGFVAEYFPVKVDPTTLTDIPPDAVSSLVRIDRQINFEPTQGDFHGSKLTDRFMVRWTGILRIPKAGNYALWLNSDDGSRLYLNNEQVIDNWGLHAMARKEIRRDLGAGDYQIRILYYDNSSEAGCIFGWDPPAEVGQSGAIPAANLLHTPTLLTFAQNRKSFTERHSTIPKASVDREGEGRRFGLIFLEGDKIVVGESSGAKVTIDPADITRMEFNNPEWDRPKENEEPKKPEQLGSLAAPWKHAVVGRLVSGASAHGNGEKIQLFTSAKHPSETFSAFSMVYRPAPKIGHITARVISIEDPAYGSYAGVVYRDGPGPDNRNAMLSIRPTGGAHMRHWKNQGGSARSDSRGDIRPPYWLRLVRDGENIIGLISPDGRAWRKIWEVPDKFEASGHIFGLVAGAREGNKPWAATFDNITVGDLKSAEFAVLAEPRIYLSDGSIIRGPVTSNETGTLIDIGKPWNRTVPALYVNRIDFFHPMSAEVEDRLKKMRPGVLLTGGDFLEASFNSLQPEILSVTSRLFGNKELRPGTAADSIVLREPDPNPRRAKFQVETWDDQTFFARGFAVSDGKFVFDSPFLGEPTYAPGQIRRIAPPNPEPTSP